MGANQLDTHDVVLKLGPVMGLSPLPSAENLRQREGAWWRVRRGAGKPTGRKGKAAKRRQLREETRVTTDEGRKRWGKGEK